MRMTRRIAFPLCICALMIGPWAARAGEIVPGQSADGRDIMQRLDDADTSRDSSRITTMVIQRSGGERVRRMVNWRRNLDGWSQNLSWFEKPDDVRNTAFLSWSYDDPDREDDMWMYLPASALLRRISGSGKKGSFMGSDLANEDIEDRAVDDDIHTFKGWVTCGEFQCASVESVPRNRRDSNYSRRLSHIRTDIWQLVTVEYYDYSSHLLKTASFSDFIQNSGLWSAGRMVVETPREKSRTVITYSDIKYNIGLAEDKFTPQSIKR